MHEYPVTQRILQIAVKTANENHASKVTKISLVVGEQSGFIGESIQMYFDILSRGTVAEGAEVIIRPVRYKLKCESCGNYFRRKNYSFICPRCGGNGIPSEVGKEFFVKNIEILESEKME